MNHSLLLCSSGFVRLKRNDWLLKLFESAIWNYKCWHIMTNIVRKIWVKNQIIWIVRRFGPTHQIEGSIWFLNEKPHSKISTYSENLKSRLVWILNGTKRLGCKWSGFWMGSAFRKPNHLKCRQMSAISSKTIWNLDKNVQISNGWDYSYSHS